MYVLLDCRSEFIPPCPAGGHTMEMLKLLPHIQAKERVFVIAGSDSMSSKKVDQRPNDQVRIRRAGYASAVFRV